MTRQDENERGRFNLRASVLVHPLVIMRPGVDLLGATGAADGAGALDAAGVALTIGTAEEGDARGW